MASKKSSEGTKGKDDLFAQFDDINTKAAGKGSKGSKAAKEKEKEKGDPLAGLEEMTAKGSRPQTPRPSSSAAAGGNKKDDGSSSNSKPAAAAPRKSTESGRGFHTAATPSGEAVEAASSDANREEESAGAAAAGAGGGGWWGGFGGLMGAASAAVRQAQSQAELIAKELQKNEEAQKWAEHVKGNAALLRSYGGDLRQITGELRSRAIPGLTNLLHTLAPPISSHERLQVHITHDLTGYPSMDPLVHAVFARVMAQVEGGDLLVLQRGRESGPRSAEGGSNGGGSTAGWSDGPWWRDLAQRRHMGAVPGLVEGSKLARASAEAFADEHFAARGSNPDEARAQAADAARSSSNPTRSSDIFLAIQPVTQPRGPELFGGNSSSGSGKEKEKTGEGDQKAAAADDDNGDNATELVFAVYLHDPVHQLAFSAVTQAVPARWSSWLDLAAPVEAGADGAQPEPSAYLPADIAELVAAGGVDPREWAAEWIEETLALGVGVVAQRYVARRMGVGVTAAELAAAGGDAVAAARTGKAEEAGAGELARAM